MHWPALARTTHKWLALIVAVQAVFWTLSGVYMTAVHIDIIHGDRLVRAAAPPPLDLRPLVEPQTVSQEVSGLKAVRLETQLGRPVYVVDAGANSALFDARTGAKLSPLGEAQVRARAKALFAGEGDIVSARLLSTPPQEIGARAAPIWRMAFAGAWRPTFYISPQTGELLARRHDLWRIYDFVWMFHILDFETRADVNNLLLRVSSWMAFATSLTGAWMLIYSFRRRRRAQTPGETS